MKRLILLASMLLSVYACQKIEFEESKCEDVKEEFFSGNLYNFPSFNPKNSDEIIFIYGDYTYQTGKPIVQLVRYNLKSDKSEVIKELDPEISYDFNAVAWSNKDWIAYIEDKKVRVMKSYGSEYNDLGIKASDLKFGDDGKLYCSVYDYVYPDIDVSYLLSYDL